MRRVIIGDRTAIRIIGIHTGVTGIGVAATGITAKLLRQNEYDRPTFPREWL
jgi:hypothetical protein